MVYVVLLVKMTFSERRKRIETKKLDEIKIKDIEIYCRNIYCFATDQ
jgi:hypothetical protein